MLSVQEGRRAGHHSHVEYRARPVSMDLAFDVLVIGGGHAGIEAAAASARMGASCALITLEQAAIGRMSCNPAIGGVGKGQLTREIDALGGLMGRITDKAGIQFRVLNTSKGRAVQSPRAQCDRDLYEQVAQEMLQADDRVSVVEGEAVDFCWRKLDRGQEVEPSAGPLGTVEGVMLADGRRVTGKAVILTTGTFLEGLLHTGLEKVAGGRFGEAGSYGLGDALRKLNLPTARLKTGTPPRIAADSVNYAVMKEQPGDVQPSAFSYMTDKLPQKQISCWETRTNAATHQIVRDNLHQAPMYAGRIDGVGPRYCPSLEDKIVRFGDRDSHNVFLEPEGWDSDLLYANGISTSLPVEIQDQFVRTIHGMENAVIVQPGYAVEYTFVAPRSLRRTLELREHPGIYLAGQICGTSGYEEAAGQGLMAGMNAALKLQGRDEFVLGRHEAYIGVMIDDLVVSDPTEPYRMFTSRAEHRLLLRHDNADARLTPRAMAVGGVCEEREQRWLAKSARLQAAREQLNQRFDPRRSIQGGGKQVRLYDVMRRVEDGGWVKVLELAPDLAELGLSTEDWHTLQADLHYEGYVKRQQNWVDRGAQREKAQLPDNFDYRQIRGLRNEAVEVLAESKPATLGAAGRLAGVTPADLALLEVSLARLHRS
jgi:tRNA uridine 5-carboxymethylaminomethyl modification enzyme